MKWYLTETFEFSEYPKWTFNNFDVALDTAHKLTHSMGICIFGKKQKVNRLSG